jgi:hypothetical protein
LWRESDVGLVAFVSVLNRNARPAPGPHSRLTLAALAVAAAACLTIAGCSGAAPGTLLGSSQIATPQTITLPHAPLAGALPHDSLAGPPADPFAGTPAEYWADGAAGIVLPAARPIGSFSAAQVKFAYEWTRKLLIAANLDKQTLDGGAPTAFANLLDTSDRKWFLHGLNLKGLDKEGRDLSTRAYVVSFAPGSVQMITSVIKVHGTMSAVAGTYQGERVLKIHVEYLFAYAVEPPGHPDQWMRLVSDAGWLLIFGDWQGDAGTFEPAYGTTAAEGIAGDKCSVNDGFVHPDWPSAAPQSSETPSGPPIDPYVLGQTETGGCQASTGT